MKRGLCFRHWLNPTECSPAAASILAAIAYAAGHIHDHCFVCGRLHEHRGIAPRTCDNDACIMAELTLLPYMDLHSELAAKGREVTVSGLKSACSSLLELWV